VTTRPTAVATRLPRRQGEVERLDHTILLVASALLVIGLVLTLSASSARSAADTGSAFTLFARQFVWAAVGFAALLIAARIDYRKLAGWTYLAVPVMWLMLVLTLIPGIGRTAGGATRWISIGPLSLQPSEAAKLVLIVFGADVLARKLGKLDDWRHVVIPYLGSVGLTALLVLMQPDFGTMTVIVVSALLIAFLAGTPLRFLAALCAMGLVVGLPIMLAEGYRRARFFGFLNPDDRMNAGWQGWQGILALGDGGLFGKGLGSSRAKYFYLPNAHTDFIVAILGEETGLLGTLTVLGLFGVLAVLCIRAAKRARDPFGFLIAAGVTGWIMLQVIVNVAAVAGVMPITGVPLPLISFGGSSLVFSLAGLGLVAGVARRGDTRPRPGRRRAAAGADGADGT
jgi:cell division protein FtsW